MSDNGGNVIPPKQDRMFILFAVRDDARFLSHRETQAIWQRAFVRADIPVAYSQGFNPRPKMSLPLPRNVALASECELLVFSLAQTMQSAEIIDRLKDQLPQGIIVQRCGDLPGKEKVLPRIVCYTLKPFDHVDLMKLDNEIQELMLAEQYIASRQAFGRHKARDLNIKDNIKSLVLDQGYIKLTMQVDQGVTARLKEIVESVGLNIVMDIEMITRTAMRYEGTINEFLEN